MSKGYILILRFGDELVGAGIPRDRKFTGELNLGLSLHDLYLKMAVVDLDGAWLWAGHLVSLSDNPNK